MQENDLVKLFLALMSEVSSVSVLKEMCDGINNQEKRQRRKTKQIRLSICSSHLLFPLHSSMDAGKREYVRVLTSGLIALACVCVSYEQKHTSSSPSSGFLCLFNRSFD